MNGLWCRRCGIGLLGIGISFFGLVLSGFWVLGDHFGKKGWRMRWWWNAMWKRVRGRVCVEMGFCVVGKEWKRRVRWWDL